MNDLRPFPSGWFVIAFSHELPKGVILSKTFMNQELVIFRTNDGIVAALDAYCPHLGAHLGFGGKIIDNCIQCPFHHLKFGTDGQCTDAKHIKAKTWQVEERDGNILIYHGDPAKKHDLLNLSENGYKSHKTFFKKLKAQPQDLTENFFDVSHFVPVHKLDSISLLHLSVSDDLFSIGYEVRSKFSLFGRKFGNQQISTMKLQSFSIGYSLVTSYFPLFDIEISLLNSSYPIDNQNIEMRVHIFIKNKPHKLLVKLILPLFLFIFCRNTVRVINEDVPIWEHKKYLSHPKLILADKAIAAFRKWTRRFYE